MFVITTDQQGSRRSSDLVPALLEELAPWQRQHRQQIERPLERTVGDEIQGVLNDSHAAVDLALRLIRNGRWSVGIGAGEVDLPLAGSARESSGPAFISARQAVERSRRRSEPAPVVVEGEDGEAAASATAVLQLAASVIRRRSEGGHQVAELQQEGLGQTKIAERLGISQQAVSQRIRASLVEEERRVRPVVAQLLEQAAGSGVSR